MSSTIYLCSLFHKTSWRKLQRNNPFVCCACALQSALLYHAVLTCNRTASKMFRSHFSAPLTHLTRSQGCDSYKTQGFSDSADPFQVLTSPHGLSLYVLCVSVLFQITGARGRSRQNMDIIVPRTQE